MVVNSFSPPYLCLFGVFFSFSLGTSFFGSQLKNSIQRFISIYIYRFAEAEGKKFQCVKKKHLKFFALFSLSSSHICFDSCSVSFNSWVVLFSCVCACASSKTEAIYEMYELRDSTELGANKAEWTKLKNWQSPKCSFTMFYLLYSIYCFHRLPSLSSLTHFIAIVFFSSNICFCHGFGSTTLLLLFWSSKCCDCLCVCAFFKGILLKHMLLSSEQGRKVKREMRRRHSGKKLLRFNFIPTNLQMKKSIV